MAKMPRAPERKALTARSRYAGVDEDYFGDLGMLQVKAAQS
jgi:hypothetical protein